MKKIRSSYSSESGRIAWLSDYLRYGQVRLGTARDSAARQTARRPKGGPEGLKEPGPNYLLALPCRYLCYTCIFSNSNIKLVSAVIKEYLGGQDAIDM